MSAKGAPVPHAATVLANLDRYMAAAGYDVDHPWRSEIASVAPIAPTKCDDERARLFDDIDEACDNIADSHSIIIGLVKSALHQVANEGPGDPKLEVAMRATLRFQHDIDSACAKIIDATSRLVEIEQAGGAA